MSTMYRWNVYVKGTREKLGYVFAWWDGSALEQAAEEYGLSTEYLFVKRSDLDREC